MQSACGGQFGNTIETVFLQIPFFCFEVKMGHSARTYIAENVCRDH